MGTWATGGPSSAGNQPLGWGSSWTRDAAAAVLRTAFDAGITVFDTADAYGAGTSERLIGETLQTVRDQVALVTKWGNPLGSQITDADDFRFLSPDWLNYFESGRPVGRYIRRLDAISDVLTGHGRTLAQGALCWLLARSPHLIPIPGARTVEQARENAHALQYGPLTPDRGQRNSRAPDPRGRMTGLCPRVVGRLKHRRPSGVRASRP